MEDGLEPLPEGLELRRRRRPDAEDALGVVGDQVRRLAGLEDAPLDALRLLDLLPQQGDAVVRLHDGVAGVTARPRRSRRVRRFAVELGPHLP